MKLLTIDGNSVLNRAFYGIKLLTTKGGIYTNGIYGFLSILLRVLEETAPDRVAVAFDKKGPTFRHQQFDGYKAGRKGMPPELAPLMLVRPVSGSAALAVGAELMKTYGVDSLIGKTAAVMLGSTETTFYTISVYFGSAGIRDTRHTVFAALLADFTGFFMACLTTRFFLT